jgi:hypothetical protein
MVFRPLESCWPGFNDEASQKFLVGFFLKSLRPSHLLDVRVKAPILRIGASKAFFKKDIRNGEG